MDTTDTCPDICYCCVLGRSQITVHPISHDTKGTLATGCSANMDVSAVLLVALLSFIFFATRTRRKPSDGRRRLPPSPLGLPVLGHLPLLGPLPHRKLQAMAAKHGPVMLLRLGRVPTVVASSAAAAQEVMKTRDLAFASRPRMRMAERLVYGRDMAFVPYGEYWRQARRVCVLHLLSHRRVLSFRRLREQEAAAMVDRVRASPGDAVNVTALIISYTNGVISRAAFGDEQSYGGLDGGEKLTKLFADFEELLGTVTMGDFVPWLAWVDTLMGLDARAKRTSAQMDALLERLIADHRHRRRYRRRREDDGHRDFLDVMLDVNEEAEKDDAGGRVVFDDVAIKAIVLACPGHVRRRYRHDVHHVGMDHGGAHQPPARDAPCPGRGPIGRRRRRPRHGGPPAEAALPEMRDQGDVPAAHAAAAAPAAGNHGGHRTAGLPRPGTQPRHHQRVGHRARPHGVGAPRRVRAGAVRRRRPDGGLLARAGLQVRAVRRREERVSWGRVCRAIHGARVGELAIPL
ncbi:unnamed protein product [Urochloa decumbens]|uniref:Uncharacterized protein n=1 Tax=Urochloa decumbens TaxID=240449 RepID=A0ABC8Z5J9_9POAL